MVNDLTEETALYERGIRVFGKDGLRRRASSACLHAAAVLDGPTTLYEAAVDESRCRRAVARAYVALNMLEAVLGSVTDEELEIQRDLDAHLKLMEKVAQKQEAGK